ncbi:hypothetical protein [Nevskia soli]|uniref:hypothetical protein n=1 Tax=Nevskia soli TaxID=418856 RepID=UPI0015D743BD|nr:hypothetical protein [Nevskia soli]
MAEEEMSESTCARLEEAMRGMLESSERRRREYASREPERRALYASMDRDIEEAARNYAELEKSWIFQV